MNQKPVFFSKKYRRSRTDGHKAHRKATFMSVEDSEQISAESSRARLMRQLSKPDAFPRDFASCFHSSKNIPCLATSHYTKDLPKRRVVIPTYPCTQSFRWNPYIESSSIEEESNIPDKSFDLRPEMRSDEKPQPGVGCDPEVPQHNARLKPGLQNWSQPEEPKFNCKCETCASKTCPSRGPVIKGTRPVFRDNIMTFCDRETMTPKLNEVGCGCGTISSTRASDVSVTASDIAVRDTQASTEFHQLYTRDHCPASILKKGYRSPKQCPPEYFKPHCCEHAYQSSNHQQEPERDIGDEFMPPQTSSIKSFFKCKKRKDCLNSRRNIYNEGISDLVAENFPNPPAFIDHPVRTRDPSPSVKSDKSKSSVRSRCCFNEIPFSHRADSRYHDDCKKSNSRRFYGENEEVRHLVTSPEITRKTYTSRPVKTNRPPSIRMPKRVLTSEKDIESFIDRGSPQIFVPAVRRPRGN